MEAEPHARLPSPGVSLLEEEPPEHWAWQASRASIQESPRMWETDCTLGGYTQVLRVKAEMPHEPGPDLLPGLGGGLLGRWGRLLLAGIIKAGGRSSGDLCELWVESNILSPWHWDPTQQPVSCNAGHLRPDNQRGGKWPCPPADRLPRLHDSQPPLDTSLGRGWPTTGPRPCCTQQQAPHKALAPSPQKTCTEP